MGLFFVDLFDLCGLILGLNEFGFAIKLIMDTIKLIMDTIL